MKKIITLIFLLIFTSQCGFKVIKQSELQDFYISEIETIGDRKINFDLKNKLSFMKKVGNKKRLKLNIITTKTNSIKEKNSSNQITKYLMSINLKVTVLEDSNIIKTFIFDQQTDYKVGNQYSQTINNGNTAIKNLTNILASRIVKELSLLKINDL